MSGAMSPQVGNSMRAMKDGLKKVVISVQDVFEVLVPGFQKPRPLNYHMLLKLASLWYGWTPIETSEVAQRLHDKQWISYPRTESTRYADGSEQELEDIVTDIAKGDLPMLASITGNARRDIQHYARKLLRNGLMEPRSDEVATGDHPPIMPTTFSERTITREFRQRARVPIAEAGGGDKDAQLYELILRYFLATASPDFVMSSLNVELGKPRLRSVDIELPFEGVFRVRAQYRSVYERGWIEILPLTRASEQESCRGPAAAKDLTLGDELLITGVRVQSESEQRPCPLTVSRLVHAMEAHGIGTDASIPKHLNTLVKRQYIRLVRKRRAPPTVDAAASSVCKVQDEELDFRSICQRQDEELDFDILWDMPGYSDEILEV